MKKDGRPETGDQKNEELGQYLASTNSITNRSFKIDFSKIESLEDIIMILKAMQLSVHWYTKDCHEQFKEVYEKGLLIEIK